SRRRHTRSLRDWSSDVCSSDLHGNADALRLPDGSPITAHSLNPVPIVIAGRAVEGRHLADGVLADVAPSLLELAGLPGWPGITRSEERRVGKEEGYRVRVAN